MLPGIHDAHTHICDWSDNFHNTVDCSPASVRSLDDLKVVTDAYIAAQRNNPGPCHRHYLIHADNLGDHDDLFRAMRNGIGVSVQTNLQSFVYEVSIARCGKRKGEALMGMRDLIDAGMHIANGSDSIGGPYGVWTQAVQAAVTRKSGVTGAVYRPDMRATVPQIIRQFTYEGAYQEFAEDTRGTIEVNKKADFCVLVLGDATSFVKIVGIIAILAGIAISEADSLFKRKHASGETAEKMKGAAT